MDSAGGRSVTIRDDLMGIAHRGEGSGILWNQSALKEGKAFGGRTSKGGGERESGKNVEVKG